MGDDGRSPGSSKPKDPAMDGFVRSRLPVIWRRLKPGPDTSRMLSDERRARAWTRQTPRTDFFEPFFTTRSDRAKRPWAIGDGCAEGSLARGTGRRKHKNVLWRRRALGVRQAFRAWLALPNVGGRQRARFRAMELADRCPAGSRRTWIDGGSDDRLSRRDCSGTAGEMLARSVFLRSSGLVRSGFTAAIGRKRWPHAAKRRERFDALGGGPITVRPSRHSI